MKKRSPVTQYDQEAGYPSAVDYRLCRRGFLKLTLGAASAVGAALLTGPEGSSIPDATARTKRKIHRVDFQIYPRYRFQGCKDYWADRLHIQTTNALFAKFLEDDKERAGIRAAVLRLMKRHTCFDLQNRKRLTRLQIALGSTLVRHYRGRRKRSAARPIVTLVITRHDHAPLEGLFETPALPVPWPE
ncbi:MAG: hypothetical protein ABI333_25730 [bacterium]